MNRLGATALLVSCALVVAACGADPENASLRNTTTESAVPDISPAATSAPTGGQESVIPAGPSALDDPRAEEFPDPLVPIHEIISGGPPPDGIPSIDQPVFMDVAEVGDRLEPQESVVVVEIEGDPRAYPVRVLIWHEIVNDTVGGVPVSITYCPLCNSAVSYRREVNGVETTFGTSGRLYASALVMYDRLTESLWTHFDGRAVVGVLAGSELEPIASPLLAWNDFVIAYPDGRVLDWTNTGFVRDYGRNPYVGYDDADSEPFLFRGLVDDRARAKQRVVGITVDGSSAAYSMDLLAEGERTVTPIEVGGTDLVVLWESGQASALDASTVGGGADVGSVGVFIPEAGDGPVTLVARGETFADEESGSTWSVAGVAIDGPREGIRLQRVEHLDTFWFAWSTYRPDTILVEE